MTTFLQLHLLTIYPASNLNRDDTGRPKTVIFGGAERLRYSSQSSKRAIRTSDVFCERINGQAWKPGTAEGHIGTRTANVVTRMVDRMVENGKSKEEALSLVTRALAKTQPKGESEEEQEDGNAPKKSGKGKKDEKKLTIGSLKKEKGKEAETNELVHLSPEELANADKIADRLANGKAIEGAALLVLVEKPRAVDIALFGRMLADNPVYNVEAAAQVAHAFTTHRVSVEDDFYTAVDDLKSADRGQDRGAGFVSAQEYGSGIFYLYICLNASLLKDNLADDADLAVKAGRALIEAAATVSPKGKQNSFASRAWSDYILLETGTRAPRTLAAAFLKPVGHDHENDYAAASRTRLEKLRSQFDRAYGKDPSAREAIVDVTNERGSLAEVLALAEEAIRNA